MTIYDNSDYIYIYFFYRYTKDFPKDASQNLWIYYTIDIKISLYRCTRVSMYIYTRTNYSCTLNVHMYTFDNNY